MTPDLASSLYFTLHFKSLSPFIDLKNTYDIDFGDHDNRSHGRCSCIYMNSLCEHFILLNSRQFLKYLTTET